MNDPLGDMLTRIRNAQMRGKSTVRTPASKLRAWVLDVLADEGYIRGYDKVADSKHPELEISLKYFEGTPVIREVKRVSKPGRRVYSSVTTLPLEPGFYRVTRYDVDIRRCPDFGVDVGSACIGGSGEARAYVP